jgi:N-acyl-D-amino-acid deacylase
VFDILVRGGTIYDGSGRGGSSLDVGINAGAICALGDLSSSEGVLVIDATGKCVAPGFIDTHSHSDLRLLWGRPPAVKLMQGVTTEILGQDGLSLAPISDEEIPLYKKMLAGLLGVYDVDWDWRSVAQYLDALENHGLPLNVAYLVPHGPLRNKTVGMEDRHAQAGEIRAMQRTLEQAITEGGVGFSTGLIYPPCAYSGAEELTELCKVAASYDVPFVVHMRNEGIRILRSIEEMTGVARDSGVHLHISHLKVFGRSAWGMRDEVLDRLSHARDEGLLITADQYPYYAGCTVLTAVLPTWTMVGGAEACLARLRDKATRGELRRWFAMGEDKWDNRAAIVGWDNVVVSWVRSEANKPLEGKNIVEVASMRGQDPEDAVCDLLLEESLAVTQITFYGSEDSIRPVMSNPWVMVCTDGIYGGKPHPRLYGSFPRVLGKYVREEGLLGLPEAIRKMTSLPASVFHLRGRGLLKEGYTADVVVFDPATITDNATFENPEQLSTGVEWVVIGGTPVVEHGSFNGKTPGKALRR